MLATGDADAAVVAAVDPSWEPRGRAAASRNLPFRRGSAGDAAVALVLMRTDEAHRRRLPVIAVLDHAANARPVAAVGRHGAHAAGCILAVAQAATQTPEGQALARAVNAMGNQHAVVGLVGGPASPGQPAPADPARNSHRIPPRSARWAPRDPATAPTASAGATSTPHWTPLAAPVGGEQMARAPELHPVPAGPTAAAMRFNRPPDRSDAVGCRAAADVGSGRPAAVAPVTRVTPASGLPVAPDLPTGRGNDAAAARGGTPPVRDAAVSGTPTLRRPPIGGRPSDRRAGSAWLDADLRGPVAAASAVAGGDFRGARRRSHSR